MAIGLVPTYATIGIAASIILTFLRLLQGLALGGEWGGGLLMAVEYSPSKKRGFYGAIPQTGALIGLALGNLAVYRQPLDLLRGGVPVLPLAHPVPDLHRARGDRPVDPQGRR